MLVEWYAHPMSSYQVHATRFTRECCTCCVILHHATRFTRTARVLWHVSSKIVIPLVQWILRSIESLDSR